MKLYCNTDNKKHEEINYIEIIREASYKGHDIWKILDSVYGFKYDDLIVFDELRNENVYESIGVNCWDSLLENFKARRIIVISCLNHIYSSNIVSVHVSENEYINLRTYYILTVFHPRVRFISEDEPFGNFNIAYNYNMEMKEYIKNSFLKE